MMNPEKNEPEEVAEKSVLMIVAGYTDNKSMLEELRMAVDDDGNYVPDWPIFMLQEKVMLKECIFKVEKIRKKQIVLRLVGRAK